MSGALAFVALPAPEVVLPDGSPSVESPVIAEGDFPSGLSVDEQALTLTAMTLIAAMNRGERTDQNEAGNNVSLK